MQSKRKATQIFEELKGGLIVSCQAEGESPFNNPADVAKFAVAAMMGGAVGIRTEGVAKAAAIRSLVPLPLIGLVKSYFDNGMVRITGSESEVEALIAAGCDMVAIDGTFRGRQGMTGPQFISHIVQKYDILVMADIATPAEAEACASAGAHCLSTTLSGYTPETLHFDHGQPDWDLLNRLVKQFGQHLPVIAEGRFNTPALAAQAIKQGAWAVVVGTAITRPQTITKWFSDAIRQI
ncbi:MAG: N-acetylmannosamine-6-phosphate 2-epimerase [Bacteroidetes bacterium]|nr:N-acetylmannosamine-6-phosphate 2-epimerase [Bacteroidota bacterium]